MQLPSDTRNELKAALSSCKGWSAYCAALPIRSVSGVPANTGNMRKEEWLAAAQAFGIAMPALALGIVEFDKAGVLMPGAPVASVPYPAPMPISNVTPVTGSPSPMTIGMGAPVAPPATAAECLPGETVYAAPIGPEKEVTSEDSAVAALLTPLSGAFAIMAPAIKRDFEASLKTALAARPSGAAITRDVPVYIDSVTGAVVAVDKASNTSGAPSLNSYVRQEGIASIFKTRKASMQPIAALPGSNEMAIWSGDDTPAIDSDYVFDNDIVHAVHACFAANKCAWLAGYAGTGKNDFSEQIAALAGRGYTRLAFHAESEVAPFVGQLVPDGKGGFRMQHGALTLAIQKPGEIILFDEVSSAANAIQTWLQAVIDKGQMTIPETGEIITVAPGVSFLVADNTLGFGDDTGAHQGKALQDRAFLDRYAQFVWFNYPPAAKEAKIITAKTGLVLEASHKLVEYANMSRDAVRKGDGAIAYPVTIRRLFAWADGLVYGMDSQTVFRNALLNCAGPDYDGLREIEKAHLLGAGHAAITALARGEQAPAKPEVSSAAGEDASGSFDAVDSTNL
jgi:cobaltochelatase CobS